MGKSIFLWVIIFNMNILSLVSADLKYSIIDLGELNNNKSLAGMNDQGEILFIKATLISNATNTYEYTSYLWNKGTVTLLENPYTMINNSGQMIGDNIFCDHGVTTEIQGYLPCIVDINDSGQFVGGVIGLQYPDLGQVASYWGGPQAEPIILRDANNNALRGPAYAINNSGQVVGFTDDVWLWDNGSVKKLGQEYQVAFDINDNGQVIGRYTVEIESSYLWHDGEVTVNLGDWSARAINNSGVVVGWKESGLENPYAVVWQDGNYYDLNNLVPDLNGWELEKAVGINNLGQIVGSGTINGQTHAFLLTPIPEPATMAMFLLGGLALARRRKP